MTTLRVGVAGIGGRLGRLIADAIGTHPTLRLAGGLVRPGAPAPSGLPPGSALFDDPHLLAGAVDLLIDVSHADGVAAHAAAAAAAGIPFVLGVTGLDGDAEAAIARAAATIPVLRAANFAPGASLVLALARRLGAALPGDRFDAEIVEMHHRGKRDAPSGTALAIGRRVAEGRGIDFDAHAIRARDGGTGLRARDAIGFASLRGGAVVGEHSLVLTSDTEQVTLSHRAFDRRVFADGALEAASWLATRPPGLYGMDDVLGLS